MKDHYKKIDYHLSDIHGRSLSGHRHTKMGSCCMLPRKLRMFMGNFHHLK